MEKRHAVSSFAKNKKAKYFGLVCLVSGFCLFAAPWVKEKAEDERQHDLLEEWRDEKEEKSKEADAVQTEELIIDGETVVGVLKIPVIELEEPILKEATSAHLNVSVSTVEPTGSPGKPGNFAVSGHNSRTYGRHFNRLAELHKGDEIVVESVSEDYIYEVGETYIVKPEDVWVLDDPAQGSEMTLITCCYPKSGEEARLIVKATLK